LKPGEKQGDKLQLVNHLFVLNPHWTPPASDEEGEDGPKRLACLELRGNLVAKELLIPLLKLMGDAGLECHDGIKYISFLRYLLRCGFLAFGGVPARRVLAEGIDALEERCRKSYESLQQEMRKVTGNLEVYRGQAKSQQWQFLHHRYAHGKLDWLSVDGKKQDLLGALSALVTAKSHESIQEMCTQALPSANDFEKVTAPRLLGVVMQPFWNQVYPRWLVGWVPKIADHLSKRCEKWASGFTIRDAMTLPEVLEMKVKHTEQTRQTFGEFKSKAQIATKFLGTLNNGRRLSLAKKAIALGHQEAPAEGEVPEPLSPSLQLERQLSQMSGGQKFERKSSTGSVSMQLGRRGSFARGAGEPESPKGPLEKQIESAGRRNSAATEDDKQSSPVADDEPGGAALTKRSGSHGVTRKEHVFEAGGIADLAAASIVVGEIDELREVLQEFEDMTLDTDGIELVSVSNSFWDDNDPKDCRCLKLSVIVAPPGAPALLAEVSLLLQRYDVLSRHIEVLDEIETGAYSEVNQKTRVYFNTFPKCQFASPIKGREIHMWEWMDAEQLASRGYLDLPASAQLIRDSMLDGLSLVKLGQKHGLGGQMLRNAASLQSIADDAWSELLGNGAVAKNTAVDRTVTAQEDGPPMAKFELLNQVRTEFPKLRWDENPFASEAERLVKDLRNYEVRMFRDPKDKLTAVQDVVILHIIDPDGERALVHLTPPSPSAAAEKGAAPLTSAGEKGYPQGLRKLHEPFTGTVKRIINEHLPKFFQDQIEVNKFACSDGVWILPTPSTVPTDVIPRAQRFFVMKASFTAASDDFALLRAALIK